MLRSLKYSVTTILIFNFSYDIMTIQIWFYTILTLTSSREENIEKDLYS